MHVRALTAEDAEVSLRASRDAFGGPLQEPSAFAVGSGVVRWGLFDGEVLAAKANDRSYQSLIGGRELSTAGVGGVVVAPEYRDRGLAKQVMTHLLRHARERGAVISTLFRTAPALYRSLGYEQVAEMIFAELPSAALAGLRVQDGITVRRATVADVPAIRSVYRQIAARGSCLLTRTGPCFAEPDDSILANVDGITLAVDDTGQVTGYASWDRGNGYGDGAALKVTELLALGPAANESLLAVLGSFASVTPHVRFRTSGTDPMQWMIPGAGWAVTDVRQYMLRVLDFAGAVESRGWPTTVDARVPLRVSDPLLPENDGDLVLEIANGRGHIEPVARPSDVARSSVDALRVGPRGLAVLLAGNVTVAEMRRAGLVDGGTAEMDAELDAAMAGPRPAILDYF